MGLLEEASLAQPVVGVAAEAVQKQKRGAGSLVYKVDATLIPREVHAASTVRGGDVGTNLLRGRPSRCRGPAVNADFFSEALVERAKIDHRSLMSAVADLFHLVAR